MNFATVRGQILRRVSRAKVRMHGERTPGGVPGTWLTGWLFSRSNTERLSLHDRDDDDDCPRGIHRDIIMDSS